MKSFDLRSIVVRATAVLLFLLVPFSGTLAQSSIDDLLDGFDQDDSVDTFHAATEEGEDSDYSFDGYINLEAVGSLLNQSPLGEHRLEHLRINFKPEINYSFDRFGKIKVSGHARYDSIFSIYSENDYTPQYVKEMRSSVELSESFYLLEQDTFDLKIGRLINIWGAAENLRVTDVINPIDSREVGMTDLEDLRLPVGAGFLTYFRGDWSAEIGLIAETRASKFPAYGSQYDFFGRDVELEQSEFGDELQYTAALSTIAGASDLQFVYADVISHSGSLSANQPPKIEFHRYQMTGMSLSRVYASLLLKFEMAKLFDYVDLQGRSIDRNDFMVGAEYYGKHSKTITMEYVQRHVLTDGYTPENVLQEAALRYSQNFMREKLSANAFVVVDQLSSFSGVFRVGVLYKPMDGWGMELGATLYDGSSDDGYFYSIRDNDRVYCRVRFDF